MRRYAFLAGMLLALAAAAWPALCAMAQEPPEPQAAGDTAAAASTTSTAGSAPIHEAADAEAAGAEDAAATTQRVRVSLVRPALDEAQRKDWADRLRQIYNQPPERWPPPWVDASVKWSEIGLLPPVEHPEDNRYSVQKAKLGELLFFDPRLSGSGQMACASCHDPDLGWADGRRVAIGNRRRQLARHTPSILTSGFSKRFFWDGRSDSLEDQARQVLLNADEMDSSAEHVEAQLASVPAYREQFKEVFGDETISIERACQAIACFERTLARGRSRFDFFLRGKSELLSDEQVIGMHLFRTEARCMNCHHGANFTDDEFHDLGLSYYGRQLEDLGRYKISGAAADVGRFKTPSLRNVANTGPYMHNGVFPLAGVLNLYNAGMPTLRRKEHQQTDPLFPQKSPLLQPLNLNRQDLDALRAFLESLSEPTRRLRHPELPGESPPPAIDAARHAAP